MINVFSNGYMVASYSVFVVLLLTCSVFDIKFKIIPNGVVLAIILLGLMLNFFIPEGVGLQNAVLGFFAGFFIMLPFYVFAGMGAGDVKLMAAIGSVVGLDKVLYTVLDSIIVMGFISLVFLIVKGDLFKLLLRFLRFGMGLLRGGIYYEPPAPSEAAAQRLPMAPAVTLATFYVILTSCHCLGQMVDFLN